MSTGTPATVALDAAAVVYTLHTYPHDPRSTSFGQEAAARLGVAADRLFKTLLVQVEGWPAAPGGRAGDLACAVVPVSGTLDLKAAAREFRGKRVVLADPGLAERATGYVIGGISPIGQRLTLPCLVEETAMLFDTVYVSAGQRGLQVQLRPADLLRLTGARYAAIASH